THHLIVLVFDDMAVPHVEASKIKQSLDARNLLGIGDYSVLEARLPNFRWASRTAERLAIHDLKLHFVHVNGVGVFREVMDLPHFDRVQGWVLADRVGPSLRYRVP